MTIGGYAAAVLSSILGDADGLPPVLGADRNGPRRGGAGAVRRPGTTRATISSTPSCSPEDAERVEGVMLEQVEALKDSLTDDDLLRTRSKIATAATLHGELPAGRMRADRAVVDEYGRAPSPGGTNYGASTR